MKNENFENPKNFRKNRNFWKVPNRPQIVFKWLCDWLAHQLSDIWCPQRPRTPRKGTSPAPRSWRGRGPGDPGRAKISEKIKNFEIFKNLKIFKGNPVRKFSKQIRFFQKYFSKWFSPRKKKLEKKSDNYVDAKFLFWSIEHGFRAILAIRRDRGRVEGKLPWYLHVSTFIQSGLHLGYLKFALQFSYK